MQRPKRKIKPPVLLKEYIILSESERDLTDHSDENSCKISIKPSVSSVKNKPIKNNDCAIFNCKNCEAKFGTKEEWAGHRKQHQSRPKGKFLCEDCGKSLSSLQSFTEHLNIHRNVKPFQCEMCGHNSRQWSVHSRHLMTHNDDGKTFLCTICSKSFKSKAYLKCHTNKHMIPAQKQFPCSNCSKSFYSKRELRVHKISHSTLRPYQCSHCNSSFKMKHNLQAHIKTHTSKRSWRCNMCNASFPQQGFLKNHQRTHTESIQHLELSKIDSKIFNVIIFPTDRRRISQYQRIHLPPNLSLDDEEGLKNSKLSLCLNDVVFPLSVVASSFGTGNHIKVKIIDPKDADNLRKAKEPINAFLSLVEDGLIQEKIQCPIEMISEGKAATDNTVPDAPGLEEELLKLMTSLVSDSRDICEESVLVLEEMASVIKSFSFPLPYEVSLILNLLTAWMQNYLVENEANQMHKNGNVGNQSSEWEERPGEKYSENINEINIEDITNSRKMPNLTLSRNSGTLSNPTYTSLCMNTQEPITLTNVVENTDTSQSKQTSKNVLNEEDITDKSYLLLECSNLCKQMVEKYLKSCKKKFLVSIKLWRLVYNNYMSLINILHKNFTHSLEIASPDVIGS